jgi:hypothetical protein
MSAASRQGSSSYVIVIAGLAFIVVGAMMLTFVLFPMTNAFSGTAIFSADTGPVSDLTSVIVGLWQFWPFILLVMLTIFVWVETRQ